MEHDPPFCFLGLATPRLCGGPCCFLRGRDPSLFPPVVRLFSGVSLRLRAPPLYSCLCPLRPLVPRFSSAWSLFGLVALAELADRGVLPPPLGRLGPPGPVGLLPHLWRLPWLPGSLSPSAWLCVPGCFPGPPLPSGTTAFHRWPRAFLSEVVARGFLFSGERPAVFRPETLPWWVLPEELEVS